MDIETDTKFSKIWMAVTADVDTGETLCHTSAQTLTPLLEQYDLIIGHNLIGFDAYQLKRLWKVTIPMQKMGDTLVMSRLCQPNLVGGHSLSNWGTILKEPKGDYTEFDNPDLIEMEKYCRQDTKVTVKLYKHLLDEFKRLKFSDQSIELEHKTAYYVAEQVRNGFYVDERALFTFRAEMADRVATLEKQLQDTFPPKMIQMKTKVKYEDFNPGSRKQIAERLTAMGWKPSKHTEKDNIIVDEETLLAIDLPEAKVLAEYFTVQKRLSQAEQWVQYLDNDGRIHGKVITNGAVTGRMTHSQPNMAQVPSVTSLYGKECRDIFGAPKGRKLVGIDASGLELRMLAHYMKDKDYTNEVVNGDVHTKNQKAAGLETRPQAKTFIYAFLYGAGAEKIGSIAGGGSKRGQELIDAFLANTPALAELKAQVVRIVKDKGSLPGLDGRRLWVRSEHAALNTLLQGAGAIVMKQALILLAEGLTEQNLDGIIVANVHDEWQIECSEEDADAVGKLGVQAIAKAGNVLGLRCPLTGEYKIGQTWADTH